MRPTVGLDKSCPYSFVRLLIKESPSFVKAGAFICAFQNGSATGN